MPDSTPSTVAQTLVIEGPDAIPFAQSQFTSAVSSMATGHWQFSAWLDAQGRVRHFFQLAKLAPDHLVLLLRGGHAEAMKNELARFVFRAKVSMRADDSRFVGRGAALAMHEMQDAEGALRFGCGDHSLTLSPQPGASDSWRAAQVKAGWPWLPDALQGIFLPPALSLHRLQAVSLEKGCYPGQEIVARLHYRGGSKRQLCRVGLSQHVPAGTSLDKGDGGATVQLLDVVDTEHGVEALAICQAGSTGMRMPLSAIHAGHSILVDCFETWPA